MSAAPSLDGSSRRRSRTQFFTFCQLEDMLLGLDSTPLGYQINGFCLQGLPHRKYDLAWTAVANSRSYSHINLSFLPVETRDRILPSLSNNCRIDDISLITELVQAFDDSSNLKCAPRLDEKLRLIAAGEIDRSVGRTKQSVSTYLQIVSDTSAHPLLLSEAVKGVFSSLITLQEFNEAAAIAATCDIHPLALAHLVTVAPLLDEYKAASIPIDRSSIAWPILYYLGYRYGISAREDVFTAFANFLATTGAKRPSLLGADASVRYGHQNLCFFLWMVCGIDIIDSDSEWEDTADLEGERVAICQLLQKLDPDHAHLYAEEISQLQQNLAVRRLMRHIAASKIHFNLDGIEKSLDPSFSDRFARYHALVQLADDARKGVELQWQSDLTSHTVVVDASFILFRELFHEVRHSFLFSNEHGLDSYLSVRIRHQTIKGELRSIFDRSNLITEKADGIYAAHPHWDNLVRDSGEELRSAIQEALAEFSEAVDVMINIVSDEWLRIRGAPGGEKGLFQVDFQDRELVALHGTLRTSQSVYDFLDDIFALLRERLLLCLRIIQSNIQYELYSVFEGYLRALDNRLNLVGDRVPLDLRAATTHCRTELQNGLLDVSQWFQLQEVTQLDPFSVQTLVTMAVDNIGKCYPSSPFRCEVQPDGDVNLIGSCFTPLWDALFQVFENIVRHARDRSADTKLEISIKSDHLSICVSNPLNSTQDASGIISRLQELRQFTPEKIRSESGSGLTKLRKIIRDDLGLPGDCVHFSVADGVFTTRMDLDVKRLRS